MDSLSFALIGALALYVVIFSVYMSHVDHEKENKRLEDIRKSEWRHR